MIVFREVDSLALHLSQILPEKSKGTLETGATESIRTKTPWFLIADNIGLKPFSKFVPVRFYATDATVADEMKTRREMPFRSLAERTLAGIRKA